jgi:hypothetical protein
MTTTASRLPTRLLLSLIVLGLLFIALHFAGIAALRHVAETQLHPALPKGTRIERVELGLFSGLLELTGFELKQDDTTRIAAGTALVDVATLPLVFGEIRVERVDLRDVYVRVDRREDGSFDLGLPPFGESGAAEAGEPSGPPNVVVERVRLEDVRLDYRDGRQRSELLVKRLGVGRFALTESDQRVPVDWHMDWDGRLLHGEAEIAMDADQVRGANGRLSIEPIDLSHVEALARLGQPLAGAIGYDGEFDWEPGRARLAGDLVAPEISYRLAERRVALTDVKVPDFLLEATFEPGLDISFTAREAARVAAWATELGGQVVTGRDLAVLGVLDYAGAGTIDVRDTDFRMQAITWRDGGRELVIDGMRLAGNLQQSITGDTPFPAANAQLRFEDIAYTDATADLAVALAAVELQDFSLSQLDTQGVRRLAGRLTAAASRVQQADTLLTWDGVDAVLGGEVGKAVLDLTTDLSVSAVKLAHPKLGEQPLQLAEVAAERLRHAGRTSFARLRLAGVELPSDPAEAGLEVAAIILDNGFYDPAQGVSLDEVVIDGLQTGVIRDPSGQWRYVTSRPAAPDNAPAQAESVASGDAETPQAVVAAAADEPAEPPAAALQWRVGAVRVTGDSYLNIADHLNPDMQAPRFHVDKLEIGEIDSRAPDQDTPFDIVLRPDEYSEFVFVGKTRPLSDLYLEAEGHLHGFALQAFNGLIANDLGHRFLNGQLDNDFAVTIDKQHLEMKNTLALSTVEVESLPDKEGPPLTMAVALLEDRDGNIKLEVPVSGDLNDPDFRVLGALNPIIMKAVAGTAALAIQPLGSVLLVGTLVADQALKVTFEPAPFEPGAVALGPEAREYLSDLAGKLKEKPKLGLRFCGVAVEAERKKDKDGKYLDQEADMLTLANDRAEAAKAFLHEQGVGKKQLRLCRPVFDQAAEAQPRVDIKF